MKVIILIALLDFVYCSANTKENKNVETLKADGGNYEGLTTYLDRPLVKIKYERNNFRDRDPNQQYNDDGEQTDTSNKDNIRNDNEKEEKENYSNGIEGCVGQFKNHIRHTDNKYGRRDAIESNQGSGNYSRYYDDETRDNCDYIFGYTGPTANDEPENLIRPCVLEDWQCIRNFFAANSKCKPAYGPIPDPLYVDVNTGFYPAVNLTITYTSVVVRGLSSAKIRDFYVNKVSGNLVFTIEVTNFNQTMPRNYFRYRRTGKESIVLADYATVQYSAVTFTAVIPKVPNLRLDLADIHSDSQDSFPPFIVGPGAYNSTDPDVITAFAELNRLVPFAVREGFLFQSQLYTSIYIQKSICDFGLKLVSV